jgi:hypothetical protein
MLYNNTIHHHASCIIVQQFIHSSHSEAPVHPGVLEIRDQDVHHAGIFLPPSSSVPFFEGAEVVEGEALVGQHQKELAVLVLVLGWVQECAQLLKVFEEVNRVLLRVHYTGGGREGCYYAHSTA